MIGGLHYPYVSDPTNKSEIHSPLICFPMLKEYASTVINVFGELCDLGLHA